MRIEITTTIDALYAENRELLVLMENNYTQVQNMLSVLDSPTLSGEAYEALRERFLELRIPAAQAQAIAFDE